MSFSNLAVDDFEMSNRYAEALRWSANEVLASSSAGAGRANRFAFVRRASGWVMRAPAGLVRRQRAAGPGMPASKAAF